METKERPIVDSVDALETAIRRVRKAEALYARYTQEQVDAIFRAAAIAANQARIPLAKLAVEETGGQGHQEQLRRRVHLQRLPQHPHLRRH